MNKNYVIGLVVMMLIAFFLLPGLVPIIGWPGVILLAILNGFTPRVIGNALDDMQKPKDQ